MIITMRSLASRRREVCHAVSLGGEPVLAMNYCTPAVIILSAEPAIFEKQLVAARDMLREAQKQRVVKERQLAKRIRFSAKRRPEPEPEYEPEPESTPEDNPAKANWTKNIPVVNYPSRTAPVVPAAPATVSVQPMRPAPPVRPVQPMRSTPPLSQREQTMRRLLPYQR